MTSDGHVLQVNAKTLCLVHDVILGTADGVEGFGSTVILTPVGTNLTFWLESSRSPSVMVQAKKKYIYGEIVAVYGAAKKSEIQSSSVFCSPGVRPSMASKTSFFTVVGQYAGRNDNHCIVQSEFLALFLPEIGEEFSLGDWIEVQGHFEVDLCPQDILL